MTIEIKRLLAFDGPNILGPQPGVLLDARSARDDSLRLRAMLKDSAQAIGVVIGALECKARATNSGYWLTLSFTTPTPALGAAAVRYLIDGLAARERGDETWDAEEGLWRLQKRRRNEALPLRVLQLVAEATARGVPAFVRADGAVQLGYGKRGLVVADEPEANSANTVRMDAGSVGAPVFAPAEASEQIAWEQVGVVPIVAIAGDGAEALGQAVAARLGTRGLSVVYGAGVGFDKARIVLADPQAAAFVLGLATDDIVRRGLPFTRCAASALLALPAEVPTEARNQAELAPALGVLTLITDPDGLAVLGSDTPDIAKLAQYAACRVEWASGAEVERIAALLAGAVG